MHTKNKGLFVVLGVFLLGFFVFGGIICAPGAKAASNAWENVGPSALGEDGYWPSLAFNPLTYQPYITYRDNTNNWRATVKKFSGTSWSDVGTPGMSYASASHTQIAFSSSGEPFVAYRDNARSYKASVLKFNGSSWQYVGDETFSDGNAAFIHLAFNPSTDKPYVAYTDSSWENRIVVKKWNGTSWENVGTPGINSGNVLALSFAFNPDTAQPYLAYGDSNISYGAVVKKFNGSAWETVGTAGFSPGSTEHIDIAFNPSTNEPYVVFEDGANDEYKGTVMKWSGSSWEYVGNPRFTSGFVQEPSIAFCPSTNDPLIAFGDGTYSYDMSVMKWNGSSWEYVGTPGFSEYDGRNDNKSFAFDPFTKEPFLAISGGGDSGNRIAVWKYDKTSLSPASVAYSAKKTGQKINFTFQDLNLSTKKNNVTIRINGKKLKISRVRKNGKNTVVVAALNHKKWARKSYDATVSFKYKTGRTTRTKTWTAKNVLTIQ